MSDEPKIVFVGQGPNRASWERAIALGRRIQSLKRSPEEFAIDHAKRIALSGSVGSKLAKMIGMDLPEFVRAYQRRNLNARFNGKNGKGDAFDRVEAKIAAEKIRAEDFDRHVLLGAEVARAFGFKNALVRWCEVEVVYSHQGARPVSYLIFPHPSGISTWWNEKFNRYRAEKALRAYLQ